MGMEKNQSIDMFGMEVRTEEQKADQPALLIGHPAKRGRRIKWERMTRDEISREWRTTITELRHTSEKSQPALYAELRANLERLTFAARAIGMEPVNPMAALDLLRQGLAQGADCATVYNALRILSEDTPGGDRAADAAADVLGGEAAGDHFPDYYNAAL